MTGTTTAADIDTPRAVTRRGATVMLLATVMAPQLGLSLLNPSIPTMAADLHTSVASVQLTLSCYMAGYAVSMFAAGILADRFDARRLQAVGLVLFAVGSIVAALAPTVTVLALARFVQAVGGTSATVLCRLVIQRRYPRDAHMRLLTSLSIVIAATPALSPLLGSSLVQVIEWRALFVVLAVVALTLGGLFLWLVPAAPPAHPTSPTPRQIGRGVLAAVRQARFHRLAAIISLAWMSYFAFIEQSAFLLQKLHGASEIQYGLLLIVPALGYIGGSVLIRRTAQRETAYRVGLASSAVGIAALIGLAIAHAASPLAVVIPLAFAFVGVGAAIPYAQAGLLDLDLPAQGVGAGTFFFTQMAAGAAYSVLVEALHLRSTVSVSIAICAPLAALCAFALAYGAYARRDSATSHC